MELLGVSINGMFENPRSWVLVGSVWVIISILISIAGKIAAEPEGFRVFPPGWTAKKFWRFHTNEKGEKLPMDSVWAAKKLPIWSDAFLLVGTLGVFVGALVG